MRFSRKLRELYPKTYFPIDGSEIGSERIRGVTESDESASKSHYPSLSRGRKLHPEIEEEGLEPFDHFKENRRVEICVRGRAGFVNRRYILKLASRVCPLLTVPYMSLFVPMYGHQCSLSTACNHPSVRSHPLLRHQELVSPAPPPPPSYNDYYSRLCNTASVSALFAASSD